MNPYRAHPDRYARPSVHTHICLDCGRVESTCGCGCGPLQLHTFVDGYAGLDEAYIEVPTFEQTACSQWCREESKLDLNLVRFDELLGARGWTPKDCRE